jgi:hypothetical protein
MKYPAHRSLRGSFRFILLLLVINGCSQRSETTGDEKLSGAQVNSGAELYYTINDFAKVEKFDSHIHLRAHNTALVEKAAEDNFRLLNVNVNSPSSPPVEEQQKIALQFLEKFPDRVLFATTFSIDGWNKDDWQEKTLAYLKDSFAKGAIAVKVWKNIGMTLRNKEGKFVMIDHPKFQPIIDYLVENKIPMIGHLGEPKNTWLPIEEMTVNGDKEYFKAHPEYHMYLHPEYPTYQDQIAARDRMLEKNPDLIFIGAHLGSLEWNTDELAKRLDKFPNMSVDMAERISHFQHQAVTDWQKVHDFFIKYQDRLVYATDQVVYGTHDPAEVKKRAHAIWSRHWRFFVTDETMEVPKVNGSFKGMKLPRSVVDKIYIQNAEKWLSLKKIESL